MEEGTAEADKQSARTAVLTHGLDSQQEDLKLANMWRASSGHLLVSRRVCVCYTRAFSDGSRNFDPCSSEDDIRAGIPSPSFHTTTTGERLSPRRLHVASPAALGSNS
ncbi:hypothetical protein TNCV_1135411 [Trichonephila clavipes]|nr:hypothetical protein TNCV_1135411 [Trichonephila clavipes]